MRRRLLTVGICCAAWTAGTPLAASAQDASSSAPGASQGAVSTTAPGSAQLPAGTVPPTASTTGPPTTAAPASTTAPATSAVPGGAAGTTSGPSSDDHKTTIVLLALIGALLALTAILWGAARWWAYEPTWWVRWRHATAEAGWRTSAAWAEFRDWVRLGR